MLAKIIVYQMENLHKLVKYFLISFSGKMEALTSPACEYASPLPSPVVDRMSVKIMN